MTNKDWLTTLSSEEFYDVWYKVLNDYGRNYIDTRTAMIEWLDREHNPDRLF